MWLLIITLCAEVERGRVMCREYAAGPYHTLKACSERKAGQAGAVGRLAADVGMRPLVLGVACLKGRVV